MRQSRQAWTGEKAASGQEIEQAILALLQARRAGASICPSEVARDLAARLGGAPWRVLMQPVRDAATRLRRRGELEILQGGRLVDPLGVRGPIRLRLPRFAERSRDAD